MNKYVDGRQMINTNTFANPLAVDSSGAGRRVLVGMEPVYQPYYTPHFLTCPSNSSIIVCPVRDSCFIAN